LEHRWLHEFSSNFREARLALGIEDCVGGIVRREAAQFLDDFFEFAVFLGLARRSLVSQVNGWSTDGDGRNHLYRVVQ
jgi:hypothetical protein